MGKGRFKGKGKRGKPRPRVGANPSGPEIRARENPGNYDREKPAWALSKLDLDGPKGAHSINAEIWWREIYPKLKSFESMTWAEILRASGSRSSGNNSHYVDFDGLEKEAQDRLAELRQDDIDQVFSLHLAATKRLIGIKDRNILHIIWYDPDHWAVKTKRR